MKDIEIDRKDHIKSIVHQLVFEYPSHELIIDRGVLKELSLRAELIPEDKDARWISRQFAGCASETLIMLVDPNGQRPPAVSEEILLKDWQSIGTDEPARDTDEPARDVVWSDKDSTFAMRVGLYRPIVMPRNRWDKPMSADGGPATQYSGGPVNRPD